MKQTTRETTSELPIDLINFLKAKRGIEVAKINQFTQYTTVKEYMPNLQNCFDFRIDIDFNSREKSDKGRLNKSHRLHSSAIYHVKGLGFNCVAKPDAFAATYAAHSLLSKNGGH